MKDIRTVRITTDLNGVRDLESLVSFMTEINLSQVGYDGNGHHQIEMTFDMSRIATREQRNAGRHKNEHVDKELIKELQDNGKSLQDIANELNVSKRTLYRRLKE